MAVSIPPPAEEPGPMLTMLTAGSGAAGAEEPGPKLTAGSGAAEEPGPMLTLRVPRLRRERARELGGCPGPRGRRAAPPPVGEPEPEPEPGGAQSPGAPVAKLAKFTFQHKSKLVHCPGGRGPGAPGGAAAARSPEAARRGPGGGGGPSLSARRPERPSSAPGSGGRAGTPGEPQQPSSSGGGGPGAEGARGPGKRAAQPECELGTQTGHPHLPGGADTKEGPPCGHRPGKVHACTLAKLANFSFTASPEAKPAALPPSERQNPGQRRPSPPPTAAATMLGRKRKTFQLEGSPEKPSLAKKSLFTLPELEDEALDFDWDEEMRKKP